MRTLKDIQKEIGEWSNNNFGIRPSYQMILGMTEELGELSHHYLKREQNIRLNEDHDLEIKDALCDLFIYLLDFCANEKIDFERELDFIWTRVQNRNWKANNKTGVPIDENS